MPLFITAKNGAIVNSDEFVMGSRTNGKVVDISQGTNVRCYLPFHGGTNQVFYILIPQMSMQFGVSLISTRPGTKAVITAMPSSFMRHGTRAGIKDFASVPRMSSPLPFQVCEQKIC
jgi:hypothetical protein